MAGQKANLQDQWLESAIPFFVGWVLTKRLLYKAGQTGHLHPHRACDGLRHSRQPLETLTRLELAFV